MRGVVRRLDWRGKKVVRFSIELGPGCRTYYNGPTEIGEHSAAPCASWVQNSHPSLPPSCGKGAKKRSGSWILVQPLEGKRNISDLAGGGNSDDIAYSII